MFNDELTRQQPWRNLKSEAGEQGREQTAIIQLHKYSSGGSLWQRKEHSRSFLSVPVSDSCSLA